MSQSLANAPKIYINSKGKLIAHEKEYSHSTFGGTFNDLETFFQSNQFAAKNYDTYLSYNNWGNSLLLAGLGGALIYLGTHSREEGNFNSGTYWLIFLAAYIPGLIFKGSSGKYLIKAINIANGIDPKIAKNVDVNIGPSMFMITESTFRPGLGLNINF